MSEEMCAREGEREREKDGGRERGRDGMSE